MPPKIVRSTKQEFSFADVFAGCGGISLGLVKAGWRGSFAIEKNADAFSTLAANLVTVRTPKFDWPSWLPVAAVSTTEFLSAYRVQLEGLRGQLTLLAGGPPCQGFSLAGRRTQSDPRNTLTGDYIELVKILQPRFLLIENVKGFTLPFKKNASASDSEPYSKRVSEQLADAGYTVFSEVVDLSSFGVPQARKRFIILAVKNEDPALRLLAKRTPFDLLRSMRGKFLVAKGLSTERPTSVQEAIGDLEVTGNGLVTCSDSPLANYFEVAYEPSSYSSPYIELMRAKSGLVPNSMRLPRHAATTTQQFKKIMSTCVRGRTVSNVDRKRLGINKHALTPLKAAAPAATITTLPDDIIHYAEPRILTARENARLQSFPDSYKFLGPYTTGGPNRKISCPRYTQIGNAVPPLFAEIAGRLLIRLAKEKGDA